MSPRHELRLPRSDPRNRTAAPDPAGRRTTPPRIFPLMGDAEVMAFWDVPEIDDPDVIADIVAGQVDEMADGEAIYWTMRTLADDQLHRHLRPFRDRPAPQARRGRLHAGPRRLGPGLRPGGHARGPRLRRDPRASPAAGAHPPGQPPLRHPAGEAGVRGGRHAARPRRCATANGATAACSAFCSSAGVAHLPGGHGQPDRRQRLRPHRPAGPRQGRDARLLRGRPGPERRPRPARSSA